jgi:hypothetical protein
VADHVFGYGSLVHADGAIPATLRGHRRVWGVAMDNAEAIPGYKRYRDPRDGSYPDVCVAFVDLEPDPRGVVEGALLPAPDLAALDARERNYARADVTDLVEGAPGGRVWAYVGREDSRERLMAARAAGRAVVQAAYARAVGLPHDGLPALDLVRVELPERAVGDRVDAAELALGERGPKWWER